MPEQEHKRIQKKGGSDAENADDAGQVSAASKASELKDEMVRGGVQTLRAAGLGKVKQGVTTIDEVLRVTAADRS